jgi:hypothetical protein
MLLIFVTIFVRKVFFSNDIKYVVYLARRVSCSYLHTELFAEYLV